MSAGTLKKKGQANQAKGKAKEAVGRITGNEDLKAAGQADAAEGKAQATVGNAGQKVKKLAKSITGKR